MLTGKEKPCSELDHIVRLLSIISHQIQTLNHMGMTIITTDVVHTMGINVTTLFDRSVPVHVLIIVAMTVVVMVVMVMVVEIVRWKKRVQRVG